jgi:MoaA/NifB/PqqE/SkfB family radical SAM enzyme
MLCCLERFFAVTVFSNGTFPLERCRDILRSDHIVINLGEADRKSYRALQGQDFFVKIVKNIRELARLRPQFNPNFCIEVVFVATRLNIASQIKTENLVRKLGADIVRKQKADPDGHSREIMLSDDEDKERKTEITGVWPPCFHGWFYSSIKLDGRVNVCCFLQRLTMGDVYKASFKDIWESEAYGHARASALRGKPFRNYHECINCRAAWRNKEIAAQMEMYTRCRRA